MILVFPICVFLKSATMKERERDKEKGQLPKRAVPKRRESRPKSGATFPSACAKRAFRRCLFFARAKKCRRKIRSLSSRRLAVDFFPSRRPSTRRASFGVFCCSLFIRRNRKGTTTSFRDALPTKHFARPKRDESNEKAYLDHFCSQTKRTPAGGDPRVAPISSGAPRAANAM